MNEDQRDGGNGLAASGEQGLGTILRSAAPFVTRAKFLSNAIREKLCERLGLLPSEVEEGSRFMDLGIDSLVAVEMQTFLASETGIPLRSTVGFDYPTIGRLVAYLVKEMDANEQNAAIRPDSEAGIEKELGSGAVASRDGAQITRDLENELRDLQTLLDGGRNG